MAEVATAAPNGDMRRSPVRSGSFSQASDSSQTAQEFIASQLQLEADAREALPYQFDTCTRPLGPLRQSLFSCLTCNPPPASPSAPYAAAGVCYSCSIACHGEHTLVELFGKRDFVCDCGSTRLPATAPCTLRVDERTGRKSGVSGEAPAVGNKYDQNFRNRFCGCGEEYDAQQQKGTMFQCLGLGTVEQGGCGEDWWHPECVVGLRRGWYEGTAEGGGRRGGAGDAPPQKDANAHSTDSQEKANRETLPTTSTSAELPLREGRATNEIATNGDATNGSANHTTETADADDAEEDEVPLPPGFPREDEFDAFLCYKCIDAFPWIKRYAGSAGFLEPVFHRPQAEAIPQVNDTEAAGARTETTPAQSIPPETSLSTPSTKRRAPDAEDTPDTLDIPVPAPSKRQKSADPTNPVNTPPSTSSAAPTCKYAALPPAPTSRLSLFLRDDFREHVCRCPACFPDVAAHPQLLEEEETYEPPVSEEGGEGGRSAGTGSLLDRGEAALSNMDRVRAIEGVMVYNHLKEKVKSFLAPFAESGQAVGAEDIKAYFETLRGDAEAIRAAKAGSGNGGGEDGAGDGGGDGGNGVGGDGRRGQSGY